MAKKIENIPLPKENFLAGYSPLTPHFADDEEPSPNGSASKFRTTLNAKEYAEIFLKAPDSAKKDRAVYVCDRHHKYLKAMARWLRDENGERMTVSGLLSNILEHHFNTHGKTIRALIERRRTELPDLLK